MRVRRPTRAASPVLGVALVVGALAHGSTAVRAQTLSAQEAIAAAPDRTATEAALRQRLLLLTDDSLMGREAGSRGAWRAAEMIADAYRAAGLLPAGEGGTYFQTVPLVVRHVAPTASLSAGARSLALWADFIPVAGESGFDGGPPRPIDGARAVFGGTLGDTAHLATVAQTAGRLVLLAAPRGADGAPDFHYWRYPGIERFPTAAGVAIVVLDILPPLYAEVFRMGSVQSAPPRGAAPVPAGLLVTAGAASALLGRPIANARVGDAGVDVRGSLGASLDATRYPARNIIGVLPGSDPSRRGEFVAMSAHHDHLGVSATPVDHDSLRRANRARRGVGPAAVPDSAWSGAPPRLDSIFNGADDDGSGTVAIIQVALQLAAEPVRPRRSLLFISHTAEEVGLVGSAWFTDHPTVPLDSIVAEIDLDMVGRGRAEDIPGGGPAYLEVVGARRLSTEFGVLLDSVAARQQPPFVPNYAVDAPGHPDQDYCRADHFSYARYGIPAVNLSRGDHIDYHQVSDEAQYIDFVALARIVQFARDLAVSVADLDHRLSVDHARPDPHAPCVQ